MKTALITVTATAALLAGCGGSAAGRPARHTTAPVPTVTSTAPASPGPSALTCADLDSVIRPLVIGLRKQHKLFAVIGSSLPRKTKIREELGAWTPPGTYSHDLKRALNQINAWVSGHNAYGTADTGAGNIDPSTPSQPGQLTGDVYNFNADGTLVSADAANGSDFASFKADVAALASDCPAD